jgi:protein O-GlcNAc transferase
LNRFYAAYRPDPTAPPVVAGPASRNSFITFASFNSLAKIAPSTLELWADILSSIENSRLIIQASGLEDASLAEQVYRLFAARKVTADRLSLRGWTPMSNFLLLGQEADIALDTFPFNGGVTTCHALWMGLPVITLCGQSAASRVGKSILSNLGLSDLVAHNLEDYKAIAQNLARDRARLSMLRASMRSRMESNGLLDGASLCAEARIALKICGALGALESNHLVVRIPSSTKSSRTLPNTPSQSPSLACRYSRMDGYRGLSSWSRSQRQFGTYGSNTRLAYPARHPNAPRWCRH